MFGNPPARQSQNGFRIHTQPGAVVDELTQPVRLREQLIDSTPILAPWPNQLLAIVSDHVLFVTFTAFLFAASLYFDSSDAGFTNHDVINVEILLTSFTRHIVEDAILLGL